MSGRARGRARGRSRGSVDSQPTDSLRRPGQLQAPNQAAAIQPVRPGPSQPPAPAPLASNQTPVGSGRASHRGGARGEVRPGADVSKVTSQMAAIGLSGEAAATSGCDMRRTTSYLQEPATRPAHVTDKTGRVGYPIDLVSNHFRLVMAPNFHIYQYHVSFKPEIASPKARRALLKQHKALLGEVMAFDGMVLFMPRKLEQKDTTVISNFRDGSTFELTIKLTAELPPSSPTCMQVFNIILRSILRGMKLQLINRSYYNPNAHIEIPEHGFDVWPGYITSILQKETSVMLTADVTHRILRMNTVLDTMQDLFQNSRGSAKDACIKKLVGQIVLTRYNNKTYRVDDIDWNKSPCTKFKLRNGNENTIAEYYLQHHNVPIHDLNQPLLVSRPKKRDIRAGQEGDILLVPELCILSGLSDELKSDYRIMKDLAVHTRVSPEARFQALKEFIDRMHAEEDAKKQVTGWNLQFEREPLALQGRVLPPEKILMGGGSSHAYKPDQADWSRSVRENSISCVPLNDWLIVFPQREQPKAQDFARALSTVGPPMGIQVRKPLMLQIGNDHIDSYLRTLSENVTNSTQMVCCILPSNRKDRYDAIKKFCCVNRPVPSQVVLSKTLSKKQMVMSVCTKVAIQLNCKLGGEVWAVEIPLKAAMVVGIDTFHDTSRKGRSVGAFVASMNKSMTRYYSRVTFQTNTQELHDGLRVCMQDSLRKYHKENGMLPDKIIVYRDGVGDGQLDLIYQHEMPQLFEGLKDIGGDYRPKTAMIVVKKRINERLMLRGRDKVIHNPPPGTVVDHDVTRPEWFDFFLVSQSVRQGTVTPTHYNVIQDTTNMKPDHFQRLTYKLCHLYYNWPGTIRVPAPCQYAHKLAELVGQSLHTDPSSGLADRLFYL